MNYARIQDGIVAEIIESFTDDAGQVVPIEERFVPDIVATLQPIPEGVDVQQGWLFDGGNFFEPAPYYVPPVAVPASVTKRQATLALFDAGKIDAVQAALDAAGPRARVEWEASTTVERDSELVQQLGATLSLDLDALFIAAAAL